eukprot:CAMPEP_0179078176 /NCGR_PEP_ID=MMETSP0796-20121207/34991_1 /TAXON_ID=73915 /ORGANISM="Pyrodinium bahamense, Strain pbaha01" /LENGTH=379 /DNA_ID=CAMNT_0020775471 /DNA_START=32 /DNA_END=1169 /DNA_ORIENTATION=-
MSGRRATLQHLQVLQSSRPLELPPAFLGTVGLAQLSPQDVFSSDEASPGHDGTRLRETVRTAEFWIALLEGEQSDLAEELAKHKQRHQLALRQTEAKASALREADGERKRLQAELRWLQQSRDQAICERRLLQEDSLRGADRDREDVSAQVARAEALERELQRERVEKADLEAQLVRVKVRYAESLQRADSLQYLAEYYEGQLRALSPGFEPADLSAVGHLMRPASQALDAVELESDASGATDQPSAMSEEKARSSHNRRTSQKVKAGISKMKQMFNRRDGRDTGEPPATPRDSSALGPMTPRVASAGLPSADASAGPAAAASAGSTRAPRPPLALYDSGGGGSTTEPPAPQALGDAPGVPGLMHRMPLPGRGTVGSGG